MPMGVASMSFTRPMPGADTSSTWAGRGCFWIAASRAGTRLSRISVVLPEPETPVTTVSRPLGMSASRGFTVWMAPVDRWMVPKSKSSPQGHRGRSGLGASCLRKGPMREAGSSASSFTVPWASTRPPSAPAPGPISTI